MFCRAVILTGQKNEQNGFLKVFVASCTLFALKKQLKFRYATPPQNKTKASTYGENNINT